MSTEEGRAYLGIMWRRYAVVQRQRGRRRVPEGVFRAVLRLSAAPIDRRLRKAKVACLGRRAHLGLAFRRDDVELRHGGEFVNSHVG
jgi:hypothetical protein